MSLNDDLIRGKVIRNDKELSANKEYPQQSGYTSGDPAKPQAADSRDPEAHREGTQFQESYGFHHDSTSRSKAELRRDREDQ